MMSVRASKFGNRLPWRAVSSPRVWVRRTAVRFYSGSGSTAEELERWQPPSMPKVQFEWVRKLLASPSPIGFEAGMTEGVIRPWVEEWIPESWAIRTFKGTASMVIDSDPTDTSGKLKVMICGHADKIRMQVRHVTSDGKIYVDSVSNRATLHTQQPFRGRDCERFRFLVTRRHPRDKSAEKQTVVCTMVKHRRLGHNVSDTDIG